MEYINNICKVCGKEFSVMKWKIGQGRGKTCSKECRHKWQKSAVGGEKSALWNGGFYIKGKGYKYVRAKDHPFANGIGYVAEHRLVVEKHIGRFLKPSEVVHHKNRVVSDNRIENLELFSSNSEHKHKHKGDRLYNTSCICGKKPIGKGMCSVHYDRKRRYGDPYFSIPFGGRLIKKD